MTDRIQPRPEVLHPIPTSRSPSDGTAAGLPSPLVTRALLGCIAVLVVLQAARFAGLVAPVGTKTVADFEVFHLVSRMIWTGDLDKAYRIATMLPLERQLSGEDIFLPWTYPPLFDLLLAPLGLLPLWLAYLIFMVLCLLAYGLVVRRLAGDSFGPVLLAIFPAICISIGCGQNGFLTGSLVGFACLGLLSRSTTSGVWAGLPLGLMVIKPHLAVCVLLHSLVTRRWRAMAVAAAVVMISGFASTIVFGPSVWNAFLDGIREARIFLEAGLYPLYRMVSSYAVLYTLGAPVSVALAAQATIAHAPCASVWIAARRLPARQALGIAVLVTMLVSPYAYDYDLPVYGIGLALTVPDLMRTADGRARFLLIALSWCASGWGMAQALVVSSQYPNGLPPSAAPLSLGGLALLALTAAIWRLLRKASREVESVAVAAQPRVAA